MEQNDLLIYSQHSWCCSSETSGEGGYSTWDFGLWAWCSKEHTHLRCMKIVTRLENSTAQRGAHPYIALCTAGIWMIGTSLISVSYSYGGCTSLSIKLPLPTFLPTFWWPLNVGICRVTYQIACHNNWLYPVYINYGPKCAITSIFVPELYPWLAQLARQIKLAHHHGNYLRSSTRVALN